ncbi:M24 family metallopeptidase [Psychrobacillus lasiicapitis]|uniref:Aminopeptidase P family protein n=1 Tax=Psychrobacillus lasiicapitis TaxID=1636719 RepID=A0A544T927_9BACI|nr:Xaa-Pro peptidase family protein [Psychrobacillus lasiicapitis]TQR13960.1 aminopeptidase P family protein [Psychrobacillus lasiicapitis]GGA36968.1 Xaa-Pro dipeptidase [Psychrobacillus lasiicapitis]
MNQVKKIQNFLQTNNMEAAFITTPDNVFYFTGFRSNPHERLLGVAIFKDAEPFIICPQMEIPDAKASGWKGQIVGHQDTDNAWDIVVQTMKEKAGDITTLAVEKAHLTVERLEALIERLPNLQVSRIDEKINDLRVIKSEEELVNMRKAAELADFAIEVGCKEIAEGKTELEILNAIELAVKEKGAAQMSFDTMVLSGPKTASPHGTPGERKIQKGDFILLDLGVVYNGYCSDITRTVAFGEPTADKREIYETVLRAEEAAVQAVKPGITAMELDKIARDVITDAGYGEYFTHRLGHGLGISVHEFPSITGVNEMKLETGMVFTIEPGIYHPEITGVRIEDDVVVTADGVEVLTKFPKDLQIIS